MRRMCKKLLAASVLIVWIVASKALPVWAATLPTLQRSQVFTGTLPVPRRPQAFLAMTRMPLALPLVIFFAVLLLLLCGVAWFWLRSMRIPVQKE